MKLIEKLAQQWASEHHEYEGHIPTEQELHAFQCGFRKSTEMAAEICQQYANRNSQGETVFDEKLSWISTYHRIAGENCRDDILKLGEEEVKQPTALRSDGEICAGLTGVVVS